MAGHVQGARAHAALVAAAVDERGDAHPRLAADVQRADALGAVHLVRGDRGEVDLHRRPRRRGPCPRPAPRRSGRARPRERHSLPISAIGCTVPISLLASMMRDQDGLVGDRRLELVQAHPPVLLHVQVGDPRARRHDRAPALQQRVLVQLVLRGEGIHVLGLHLAAGQLHQPEQLQLLQPLLPHALQALAGVEDGLVLGLQGDDVVALGPVELDHALERQVVRLGGAAGEDDLLGLGADERRHLGARLLDRRLGLPAERMVARRGVPEVLPQVGQHRLQHARVERGGGVVIHVDGKAHSGRSGRMPTLAYQCGPGRSIITRGVLTSRWKPAASVGVSSLDSGANLL